MEINLIREQSITVRSRLPSTSAKHRPLSEEMPACSARAGAGQDLCERGRPGVGGADHVWAGKTRCGRDRPLWAGREGLVWAWTGRGQTRGRGKQGGRGKKRWAGRGGRGEVGWGRPAPLLHSLGEGALCRLLPGIPPAETGLLCVWTALGALTREAGLHLLLHQKQDVSRHMWELPKLVWNGVVPPGPVQSSTRPRSTSVLNSRCR